MHCPQCHHENEKEARFCEHCGAPLPLQTKKKRPPSLLWGGLVVGVVALLAAGWFLISQHQPSDKAYQETLETAQQYLMSLDYENAKASYLEAVDIEPKQASAYLALADIYMLEEDPEEAAAILEQGLAHVGEDSDEAASIQAKQEEIIHYTWLVLPQFEADALFYLKDDDLDHSSNELICQYQSDYAVYEKAGRYGLIGHDGVVLTEPIYASIVVDRTHYLLVTEGEPYQEVDGQWNTYILSNDTIMPFYGADGYIGQATGVNYYYTTELMDTDHQPAREPQVPIPVAHYDTVVTTDLGRQWQKTVTGPYAIYSEGGLQSDFVYSALGSYRDGLMAACQDGKWGYVNAQGEVVIPFAYDASWAHYAYADDPTAYSDMCYSASDGYVVLSQNGTYALADTTGKTILMDGTFDEILPVVDGKAFVRMGTHWGVIVLNDDSGSSSESLSDEAIIERVEDYFGPDYVIFESEVTSSDKNLQGFIRYQGGSQANLMAGTFYVDKQSGDVKESETASEVLFNLYQTVAAPAYPSQQDDYLIYTDVNGVEMTCFANAADRSQIYLVYDGEMVYMSLGSDAPCEQYRLVDGQWQLMSTEVLIARQPTKLLASNLEIYDEDHQLLVASSEYVDLDWSKIHA